MLKPSLAGLRFNEGLCLQIPPFLLFHILPLVWKEHQAPGTGGVWRGLQIQAAPARPRRAAPGGWTGTVQLREILLWGQRVPALAKAPSPGQKSVYGVVVLPGHRAKPGKGGI